MKSARATFGVDKGNMGTAIVNGAVTFVALGRNLIDRRRGDVILLGQQGNWDMLSVVLEIDLLPLQRSQLGAFVDVHFGRLLPGRFSPATLPGLQRTQNQPADELAKGKSLKAGCTAPGQSTKTKRMPLKAAFFIDLHSSSMKPSFVDNSCVYCG